MPYATVSEYVALYGERETILFTNTENTDPAASYDPIKVEEALSDATDEVDGYISKRYATPLVSPPTIARGWVKAIARLKLAEGTGRVPDAVKEAADRATRQLEQLAANKLNLPIPEGSAPAAPVETGAAMTSGDRVAPLFSNGALDGFMEPFRGGGGYAPCWRRGG